MDTYAFVRNARKSAPEADVIGELGFRHQLTPQLVADVGVSRSFAGQVRSSGITLGMSFNLPLQLRGAL